MRMGHRIKERREELGWTQADLAARVGVSGAAVGAWEAGGGMRGPSLSAVAMALGVTHEWLLGDPGAEKLWLDAPTSSPAPQPPVGLTPMQQMVMELVRHMTDEDCLALQRWWAARGR